MPKLPANGIEISYDSFGDENADPLVLIMGLGAQMLLWHEDFCEALAERGHWVIRYDNRDVGLSTYFDEAGVPDMAALTASLIAGEPAEAPYSVDDMADDGVGLFGNRSLREFPLHHDLINESTQAQPDVDITSERRLTLLTTALHTRSRRGSANCLVSAAPGAYTASPIILGIGSPNKQESP